LIATERFYVPGTALAPAKRFRVFLGRRFRLWLWCKRSKPTPCCAHRTSPDLDGGARLGMANWLIVWTVDMHPIPLSDHDGPIPACGWCP